MGRLGTRRRGCFKGQWLRLKRGLRMAKADSIINARDGRLSEPHGNMSARMFGKESAGQTRMPNGLSFQNTIELKVAQVYGLEVYSSWQPVRAM